MSEQITLDKILENLVFFDKRYDAARLVDLVGRCVLEYREYAKADEDYFSYWEDGRISENSIAVRAYQENRSFIKLDQRPDRLMMVTAVPMKTKDKPVILELLINATDALLVGSGDYNNGQLVQDIMSNICNMIIRDGLTSLHSRGFIDERLPEDIAKAAVLRRPLSVIFIDVDDLKIINDTYGHMAGDLALKEIGTVIQRNIRLQNDWVARYGGDEFLISLYNTVYDEAYQIAERIRKEIEGIVVTVPEGRLPLSISLGVHTLNGS